MLLDVLHSLLRVTMTSRGGALGALSPGFAITATRHWLDGLTWQHCMLAQQAEGCLRWLSFISVQNSDMHVFMNAFLVALHVSVVDYTPTMLGLNPGGTLHRL